MRSRTPHERIGSWLLGIWTSSDHRLLWSSLFVFAPGWDQLQALLEPFGFGKETVKHWEYHHPRVLYRLSSTAFLKLQWPDTPAHRSDVLGAGVIFFQEFLICRTFLMNCSSESPEIVPENRWDLRICRGSFRWAPGCPLPSGLPRRQQRNRKKHRIQKRAPSLCPQRVYRRRTEGMSGILDIELQDRILRRADSRRILSSDIYMRLLASRSKWQSVWYTSLL